MSIADRALMRKYKSPESVRGNLQQAGAHKREIASSVSRVDGHPLKPFVSLYDRALLRKYPDANSSPSLFSGMQPLPSSASMSVSTPPVVFPIAKKRKSFFLERGIPRKQMPEWTRETSTIRIRQALPVDFSPRLQSLLFLLLATVLPQLRLLNLQISRFCTLPLWRITHYLLVIYENSCPCRSQHVMLQKGR